MPPDKNNNRQRLPAWLNIRQREAREVKPEIETRPFAELRSFSRGSLWASTGTGGLVSFFLFRSAFHNMSSGKMIISSQMGRLRSTHRWPDDWGFFATIVGFKLMAGTIFLIATIYCLNAAFRSHDK